MLGARLSEDRKPYLTATTVGAIITILVVVAEIAISLASRIP